MSVYRAKSSLFSGLNAAQREAVEHIEGPLLMLAGAGTDKTQIITRRIAHLLERGVSPYAVLAVTFTRKAATEMRKRVETLLGTTPQGLTVSTFHALGYRILRENGYRLKFGRRIAVYGEQERFRLMDAVLESTQVRLPGGAGTKSV